MPRILPGAPAAGSQYLSCEVDGVQVFYASALRAKSKGGKIRIKLKTFLFTRWKEIEGARAIVSAPSEEPIGERR